MESLHTNQAMKPVKNFNTGTGTWNSSKKRTVKIAKKSPTEFVQDPQSSKNLIVYNLEEKQAQNNQKVSSEKRAKLDEYIRIGNEPEIKRPVNSRVPAKFCSEVKVEPEPIDLVLKQISIKIRPLLLKFEKEKDAEYVWESYCAWKKRSGVE